MRGLHRIFAVGVILALGACGKGSPAGPSSDSRDPLPPGANGRLEGRLAFSSSRDGSDSIYVAEGSQVRRLTPGMQPSWSPDGRIAFHRPGAGIYVINADGSGERFLGWGFSPDWSPDGRKIVFTGGGFPDGGIFVMDADGSGATKLLGDEFVTDVFGTGGVQDPVWSPDGRSIAFVRGFDGGPFDIYIMNADGSNPGRLVPNGQEPSWSPNGLQLAFQGAGSRPLFGSGFFPVAVGVINADGSGERIVVTGQTPVLDPDWYSNGALVFSKVTGPGPTVGRGGGFELRIFVATEGGGERQIIPDVDTGLKYADGEPAWAR